ncbi:16S rRNA (guanine(527)-N(7))-methyltransferase RsmG [Williamsia sp. CHRR-6]|uniref:16S rRNA (guanine(527)-N(7))-methyltransferase RsmG n=1 Tax=Williamsia sp. CHRR-6 TaxID=2835871 RepID=UPI001BDB3BA6|nr:16S rRNA (guanine(527)-N(7))-methyltransferase RsmG [Williamsia sp. CHRR-6]MBT0567745.1 16S rRNA (guanine(527)-N(7))-methyltransferase RsmG [Williamsia sp. CHRR-6]
MFHVKQDDEFATQSDAITAVFGQNLTPAMQYREFLATAGVERGLIGPREVDRLWSRHLLNCAVIGEAIDHGTDVVDVGSGSGLPGIPLALARPDLQITLVEPLLRRSTFLAEIVTELGIGGRVQVIRGRAEEKKVRTEIGGASVVTSRAVAPLDRLARWCVPLLRGSGELIAIKGSSAPEEVATHRADVGKLGLLELRVEVCGTDRLSEPTTIIRGRMKAQSRRR